LTARERNQDPSAGFNGSTAWIAQSPPGQPTVREINNASPIPAQLLPSDQVVVVKKACCTITDYVYFGDETPAQQIARFVRTFDGIAIVEIGAVEGTLIDGDKWIRTKVTGPVKTVLKNSALFPGDRFEFQYNDGLMKINGVEVQAGDYPILKTGSRFLVFIETNYTERWLAYAVDVTDPRRVTRPQFANVDPANVPNVFNGMSLAEAQREIRKSLEK
jgi:hypothetical protein